MRRRHGAAHSAAICAVASSVFVAMTLPTLAQEASPLAAAATERHRYADGNRLQAQYESVNEAVDLPPARPAARAAAAGLAAAARIQANLPDGLALLNGSTSHISPRPQAAQAAAAPSASAADSSEKFITLFPLAYHGVPLSKGSDYLSVVDGEGRLLVTRKRGLPSKVDATVPSVSAVEAVSVARQAAGQAFSGVDPEKIKTDLQIWVDEQQNGNLAWTFTLSSGSLIDPDVRRYWVAAVGQPSILNWETEVHHTYNGQVTGNLWTTTPLAVTGNRAQQQLEVRRSTDSATQITGADGRYGYTTGTGSAEIKARLRGPLFVINNQSAPPMEVSKTP